MTENALTLGLLFWELKKGLIGLLGGGGVLISQLWGFVTIIRMMVFGVGGGSFGVAHVSRLHTS